MSLEVLVPDMKRQLVGYRSQQLTLCFLNMNLKLFELLKLFVKYWDVRIKKELHVLHKSGHDLQTFLKYSFYLFFFFGSKTHMFFLNNTHHRRLIFCWLIWLLCFVYDYDFFYSTKHVALHLISSAN